MAGLGGIDRKKELAAAGIRIPIIFITGHGDMPMSVQAMKGGAIEFLTKPFRDQQILDAIQVAIEKDVSARKEESDRAGLRTRYASLTPRATLKTAGNQKITVTGTLNPLIPGTSNGILVTSPAATP